MNLTHFLKILSETSVEDRSDMMDMINIQNYASNILSETDMWVLQTASQDEEYLETKLKEAELTLDTEAPSESEELSLEEPSEGGEELSLEEPSEGGEELTLSEPTEGGEELSLSDPSEDELSLEEPTSEPSEGGEEELTLSDETSEEPKEEKKEKEEIETSLEGIGILPLLAEIQEKLANGKPSEVELAALKAMKKLF